MTPFTPDQIEHIKDIVRKEMKSNRSCLKKSTSRKMKDKPWIKGTTEGKLYVDTSHPEWQKWFVEQIKKYSKLNILNRNQ